MNKYLLVAFLFGLSSVALFLIFLHHVQVVAEARHSEYLSDLRTGEFAGIATMDYATHHNGKLPDAHHWEESIAPYWSDPPYSVSIKEHPGDRLAMNKKLSGLKLGQIALPDNTVLFYETHSNNKNASGLPPWKQYRQCGMSTKEWLIMVFASGWSSSYAEGPGIAFQKK